MNDHNKRNGEEDVREAFELTPSEKKALETLPRDCIPRVGLEDRVVRALRDRGLLERPRRRVIELTTRRIAAFAAACLVLLAGCFALGQWVGTHQIERNEFVAPETGDMSVAEILQQTGSAYVLALQRFAELSVSVNEDQAAEGREIALTTLYTAADQVTRLVPKNELARQLLVAIAANPDATTALKGGEAVTRGVIEF
jgi:hypothetical protein